MKGKLQLQYMGKINTKRSKIKIKVVHEGLHICISQKGEIFHFQKGVSGGYRFRSHIQTSWDTGGSLKFCEDVCSKETISNLSWSGCGLVGKTCRFSSVWVCSIFPRPSGLQINLPTPQSPSAPIGSFNKKCGVFYCFSQGSIMNVCVLVLQNY